MRRCVCVCTCDVDHHFNNDMELGGEDTGVETVLQQRAECITQTSRM